MRAHEFISETKSHKLSKRQSWSTTGMHIVNDGPTWASDYGGYRVMMAAAGTDGVVDPDMSPESYIGRKKTAYPYTKADEEKLKKAYKIAGMHYRDPNNGDMRSLELPEVNRASPVAKPKKNKYGV
jgi:hypothetical protein